jgi:hypothetical protein
LAAKRGDENNLNQRMDSGQHVAALCELDLHFAIIQREEFEKQDVESGFRILRMWGGDYPRNPFNLRRVRS